MTILLKIWW